MTMTLCVLLVGSLVLMDLEEIKSRKIEQED